MLALLLLLTIAALPIHFITRTFFRRLNLVDKPDNLKKLHNSKQIDKRGFFIGLPTTKLSDKVVKKLAELLLKVSKF